MKRYDAVVPDTRSSSPTFLLGDGAGRQRYALVDSYCDNPKCPAAEALVHLIPERDPARPIKFWLRFQEGTIAFDAEPGDETKKLAADFVDEHWSLLARRWHAVRASGLARLRRKADHEVALTYSFRDFAITHESFVIPFKLEGRSREVIDAYCVDPACPCMDAFLHFIEERGEGQTVARDEFAATVDLETGAIRGPKLEAIPEARRAMVAAFLDSLGDWSGELRLRRRILRGLARKRLRFDPSRLAGVSSAPQPSGASSRVREIPDAAGRPAASGPRFDSGSGSTSRPPGAGLDPGGPRAAVSPPVPGPAVRPIRNGPCPCGSGRKYKNCCAP